MKKVLFDLDQDEKNRILEMHQTATRKQYLTEDTSENELLEVLPILDKIDEITKRIDLNLLKFSREDKEMFTLLSDIQSKTGSLSMEKNIPIFDDVMAPGSKSRDILIRILNGTLPDNDGSFKEKVEEFLKTLIGYVKEYFPNNELSEVMELLENFDTHLDENYKS
jgi:hypothetical protein